MNSVWKKLIEYLSVYKMSDIPPVLRGAGALICCSCNNETGTNVYEKAIIQPESIADIVHKYGNRDIYKGVYQFIK